MVRVSRVIYYRCRVRGGGMGFGFGLWKLGTVFEVLLWCTLDPIFLSFMVLGT